MCSTRRWALVVLSSAQLLLSARTLASQRQAPPCASATLPALVADTATPDERANTSHRPCPTVSSIDSSYYGGVTARTLSEAVAGQIAGVSVLRSSGVVGTGSRVRMRGGSGLLIPREPLLVIDGLRVDASQSSLGVTVGGQTPSRLDDIPLDDIERIETLRGPAASALYGTDAAGGVIVITTKHGTPGAARWSSHVEGGVANDVTSYPTNTATGPPTF